MYSKPPHKPSFSPDLALILVTAIWGSTFLIVQESLPLISPLLFLALRFALATLVLALIYRKRLHRAAVVPGAIAGLFLFAGYAFQTIGLQFTTASKSAFLTSLSVPMVPLAASLVYRRVPGRFELLGVLVATAGMVLLTFPGRIAYVNNGDALSFLCAISFAGQIVAVGHFANRANFESLVTMQMVTVTLLSLATFWWVEKPVFRPTFPSASAVLATGLFATALAFSIQAWAQQYTTVTRTAIIYALEPVFAAVTSFAVVGEMLTKRAAFGAGLILFGILIVELKRGAAIQHP
jgi:drug/metabolite transporter (DMT)-like permease